jgi:hypothetical protein
MTLGFFICRCRSISGLIRDLWSLQSCVLCRSFISWPQWVSMAVSYDASLIKYKKLCALLELYELFAKIVNYKKLWAMLIHTLLHLVPTLGYISSTWPSFIFSGLYLIHTRTYLIPTWLHLIYSRLHLIHTWLHLTHISSTLSYNSSTLGYISSTSYQHISYTLGQTLATLGYVSSTLCWTSYKVYDMPSTLGYISASLCLRFLVVLWHLVFGYVGAEASLVWSVICDLYKVVCSALVLSAGLNESQWHGVMMHLW